MCQIILNNSYFRTYADTEKVSAHRSTFNVNRKMEEIFR